jgi:hypothetical protein
MTIEAEIQDICTRIAQLIRGAYKRGEADAIDRLMRAARSEVGEATLASPATMTISSERKRRAPKGSVGAFVDRVLANGADATVREIQERAIDDTERMVAPGSIRAHLRTGREAGLYVERRGRWYAVRQEGQKSTETADPARGHAASALRSNQEDR